MRVFIGFDKRQPLAYTVARSSVERHAKGRVLVEPLRLDWLPITRRGLTDFTFSRYLVPWLCDYQGVAVFLDADTIVRADIRELEDLIGEFDAVAVVQGELRFEWPSVMVFRCDNYRCRMLTPAHVNDEQTKPHTLDWAGDRVGALPLEWNHIVPYMPRRSDPKLVHYTAGIPCWPETRKSEHAELWLEEYRHAVGTCSWEQLMGQSVHRQALKLING